MAGRAQTALQIARQVLEHPSMHGLDLHLFKALAREKRLIIALDRVGIGCVAGIAWSELCSRLTNLPLQLDNPVGSPTFEDLQGFQQAFVAKLEAALSPAITDELDYEVSSPVRPLLGRRGREPT